MNIKLSKDNFHLDIILVNVVGILLFYVVLKYIGIDDFFSMPLSVISGGIIVGYPFLRYLQTKKEVSIRTELTSDAMSIIIVIIIMPWLYTH